MLVLDAGGSGTRLRGEEVEELRRSETSLMPKGLERALTRDEFRDLLAYLKSLD